MDSFHIFLVILVCLNTIVDLILMRQVNTIINVFSFFQMSNVEFMLNQSDFNKEVVKSLENNSINTNVLPETFVIISEEIEKGDD